MRGGLTRTLVLVAALGLLGACSDDEKSDFPTGVFIPVSATSTDGGSIEYTTDGKIIGTDSFGRVFTEGTYTVDGDQLTIVTDTYCETQFPGSDPVTYTFTWDGTTLHFVPNPDDACADRVETFKEDSKLAPATQS